MRKFLAGVIVGSILVMGAAEAIPWPGEWRQAPMDAGEYTFLYKHGYCERGTKVKRVGERPSNNYMCVAKTPQP